ncbi:MAG: acetate--CoA ligase family protein [Candidatus Sericytochromatia bacterium]|nr:acetate--CoA ligase family protein [Candidatus Sericytochromatia bacterium]
MAEAAQKAPGEVLHTVAAPGVTPGVLPGMRDRACVQPLVWVRPAPEASTLEALDVALTRVLRDSRGFTAPEALSRARHAIAWAFHWTDGLLALAGLPLADACRLHDTAGETGAPFIVLLPVHADAWEASTAAFHWVRRLLNAGATQGAIKPLLAELPDLLQRLRAAGPRGANTTPFLRAARELRLPVSHLAGGVFQFGLGARARTMRSSCTDVTPSIGAELARNKLLAGTVLRQAGIPVPPHAAADTPEAAERIARALGFPVVVKPGNLDGGVGVAPGLQTAEAVRAAFEAARELSPVVIVERHVDGRDHRLTVFQGEVIWAIERIPGGVTGDGRQSVGQLLEELNAEPRRNRGPQGGLQRLELDAEARAMLSEAGLTLDSVPANGRFVRLRRAANIALGGTPVAVHDVVHPDNRLLAVRAAAALGLDLAGVDLLIPDISRSWHDTGAAVCEVNAQPNLGTASTQHLHPLLLRRLVPGDGRIPTALVVGAPPDARLPAALAGALAARGVMVGCRDDRGVQVGQARVAGPMGDVCAEARVLMQDRKVQAAVIAIDAPEVLHMGLPFDRYDMLIVAGSAFRAGPGGPEARLRALVEGLLPACDGAVLALHEAGLPALPTPQGVIWRGVGATEVLALASRLMAEAEVRHRNAAGPAAVRV